MSDKERDDRPVTGLERLYMDREPSPALEERVVAALRSEESRAPRTRWWAGGGLAATAAAALVFLTGWSVGRMGAAPADPALPSGFMFLLVDGPDFDPGPDPGRLVREYGEWARTVRAEGVDLVGAELGPAVRIGGGPGAGPGEARPGGFFLVEVGDLEAARSLARTHPHLGYGGWIEVAEIR